MLRIALAAACWPVLGCTLVFPFDREAGCDESARSCLELLERCPSSTSGPYELDPDGAGTLAPFRGYCDMGSADGGWMLIGRSAEGSGQVESFGWMADFGSVDDDAEPYSLDVSTRAYAFTQLLVGDHAHAKGWSEHLYVLQVAGSLPAGHEDSQVGLSLVSEDLVGNCKPQADGWMFRFAGYTTAVGHFYFRDVDHENDADGPYDTNVGLRPNQWFLAGEECRHDGGLAWDPGMLFARERAPALRP